MRRRLVVERASGTRTTTTRERPSATRHNCTISPLWFVHHRLLSSLLDHRPSHSTSDVEEGTISSSPTSMCVFSSLFSFCLSRALVLCLSLGTHAYAYFAEPLSSISWSLHYCKCVGISLFFLLYCVMIMIYKWPSKLLMIRGRLHACVRSSRIRRAQYLAC
jgi:hypothetical protein